MRRIAALGICLLLTFPLSSATYLSEDAIKARVVLESYRRAWPGKIEELRWENDDWTIKVNGKNFYWAHGRILPESMRATWEQYKPYIFYSYPEDVLDPEKYSDEEIERLRIEGQEEERMKELDHHKAFSFALYGGATRASAEDNLRRVRLFGKKVTVHKDLVDRLERIDAVVQKAAERDSTVAWFMKSLGSLSGYNWREIRGTTRRSFHSWGLAIDVEPKRLGGKSTYWGWERDKNEDWMLLPLEQRWSPPKVVIRAFEDEGFIWGGKWDLWDTMHFEYRPELHELAKVQGALGGTAITLEK